MTLKELQAVRDKVQEVLDLANEVRSNIPQGDFGRTNYYAGVVSGLTEVIDILDSIEPNN